MGGRVDIIPMVAGHRRSEARRQPPTARPATPLSLHPDRVQPIRSAPIQTGAQGQSPRFGRRAVGSIPTVAGLGSTGCRLTTPETKPVPANPNGGAGGEAPASMGGRVGIIPTGLRPQICNARASERPTPGRQPARRHSAQARQRPVLGRRRRSPRLQRETASTPSTRRGYLSSASNENVPAPSSTSATLARPSTIVSS